MVYMPVRRFSTRFRNLIVHREQLLVSQDIHHLNHHVIFDILLRYVNMHTPAWIHVRAWIHIRYATHSRFIIEIASSGILLVEEKNLFLGVGPWPELSQALDDGYDSLRGLLYVLSYAVRQLGVI